MHSVELLADALNKYQGSIILVSHDRFFISKTANKIWEIVDQEIKEFKGTYAEWVAWNERMETRKKQEEKNVKPEIKAEEKKVVNPSNSANQGNNNGAEQSANNAGKAVAGNPINRELQRELQKHQRKLQNIEADLTKASSEKLRLEAELAAPENYVDRLKFKAIEKDYERAKQDLVNLNKEYELLFEKVMELEEQAG